MIKYVYIYQVFTDLCVDSEGIEHSEERRAAAKIN